jgi:hypothetical protein
MISRAPRCAGDLAQPREFSDQVPTKHTMDKTRIQHEPLDFNLQILASAYSQGHDHRPANPHFTHGRTTMRLPVRILILLLRLLSLTVAAEERGGGRHEETVHEHAANVAADDESAAHKNHRILLDSVSVHQQDLDSKGREERIDNSQTTGLDGAERSLQYNEYNGYSGYNGRVRPNIDRSDRGGRRMDMNSRGSAWKARSGEKSMMRMGSVDDYYIGLGMMGMSRRGYPSASRHDDDSPSKSMRGSNGMGWMAGWMMGKSNGSGSGKGMGTAGNGITYRSRYDSGGGGDYYYGQYWRPQGGRGNKYWPMGSRTWNQQGKGGFLWKRDRNHVPRFPTGGGRPAPVARRPVPRPGNAPFPRPIPRPNRPGAPVRPNPAPIRPSNPVLPPVLPPTYVYCEVEVVVQESTVAISDWEKLSACHYACSNYATVDSFELWLQQYLDWIHIT